MSDGRRKGRVTYFAFKLTSKKHLLFWVCFSLLVKICRLNDQKLRLYIQRPISMQVSSISMQPPVWQFLKDDHGWGANRPSNAIHGGLYVIVYCNQDDLARCYKQLREKEGFYYFAYAVVISSENKLTHHVTSSM